MTETSPLASTSRVPRRARTLSEDEQYKLRATQGRVRVSRSSTTTAIAVGEAGGELQVRGPWVAARLLQRRQLGARSSPRTAGCAPATSRELVDGSLHQARGSHQGPRQVRRRMDLLGRARERDHGPPGRARGGGDRRARRALGRAPLRVRRRARRADRSTPTPCSSTSRPRVAKWWLPDRVEFIDEVPEDIGRQVRQEGAARSLRGDAAPTA